MNCNTCFFVVFFKFSSKVHSLLLNSFAFHFLPSDVWLISAHHHRRILGGGVNLRSVPSHDADKMVILGSFFRGIILLFTGTTSCLVSNCSLEAHT